MGSTVKGRGGEKSWNHVCYMLEGEGGAGNCQFGTLATQSTLVTYTHMIGKSLSIDFGGSMYTTYHQVLFLSM